MELVAEPNILNCISKIKAGDQTALEKMIEDYRPFIMKTTVQFCKRMLEWGHDDELSISLMAFNSAVDTYDPGRQTNFLSYCRVVIGNRLKDYVRQQVQHQHVVQLDDEAMNNYLEGQAARDEYLNQIIEHERREELERYEEMLSLFSIGFEDLIAVSPKHQDYRETLFKVARKITQSDELWKILTHKKQLPLNELEKACGVKRKTLERGRKFIIACAVLLGNLDEFIHLGTYIKCT